MGINYSAGTGYDIAIPLSGDIEEKVVEAVNHLPQFTQAGFHG